MDRVLPDPRLQLLRLRAGREIWFKLYGDLPRELFDLRLDVMRALPDPWSVNDIATKFFNLTKRLEAPL